jgi:hypothetical protein
MYIYIIIYIYIYVYIIISIYSLPHIIKRLKQPHLWNPQFLTLHIYAVFTIIIIIIITNHHHYLHLFTSIYTRVTIYHHHYLHHYLHQLSPTIIICRLFCSLLLLRAPNRTSSGKETPRGFVAESPASPEAPPSFH